MLRIDGPWVWLAQRQAPNESRGYSEDFLYLKSSVFFEDYFFRWATRN